MMPLPIDHMVLRVDRDVLHVESAEPLHVVSSALVGAELDTARHILSLRVPRDFHEPDPALWLKSRAWERGLWEPFVGLLTAVDLRTVAMAQHQVEGCRALALVTAGVGNATAAGRERVGAGHRPGTINIVVIVDAVLGRGALVNAAMVATEAKTLAVMEAGVRTKEGLLATGTSTDAIVVAYTGRGESYEFAGPVTPVGHAVGVAVQDAVAQALRRNG